MLDAGVITREVFARCYQEEHERLMRFLPGGSDGGDFYRSLAVRVGRRFARAVVVSTMEGRTLFREAFRLLGVRKGDVITKLGRTLGYEWLPA